jgi:hypothetical protein
MTQFEVMINLVGIKTKEGEDFVKVIKHIGFSVVKMTLFDIYLEDGSIYYVNKFGVRQSGGTYYLFSNYGKTSTKTFWSEFRRAMTEIAGLYEF